ncbi:MAG: type II secretion system F family protein [Planctomycetota bacterium]|jgi:tight adherence protein B
MNQQQLINIIAMMAVFGLVFSVWCICIFLWFGKYLSRLQSVQKRLGIVKKETGESHTLRLWRETQQNTKTAISADKLTLKEQLEKLSRSVGWSMPVHIIFLGVFGATILGFIVAYFWSGRITWGVAASIGVVIGFWSYTRYCITERASLIERQLVDALGIAARALRAGHPLLGAFQLISEEIEDPIKDIFLRICQEQMLGLDLKDSIQKVAKGSYNQELKFFATAVAIQLQSGGNLADLMDSLASVIRSRIKLNRRVRVMTAATQFSKKVLIALPIMMFFLLDILNPEYMKPLYTTKTGTVLLIIGASAVLFGTWVMNRMCILRF